MNSLTTRFSIAAVAILALSSCGKAEFKSTGSSSQSKTIGATTNESGGDSAYGFIGQAVCTCPDNSIHQPVTAAQFAALQGNGQGNIGSANGANNTGNGNGNYNVGDGNGNSNSGNGNGNYNCGDNNGNNNGGSNNGNSNTSSGNGNSFMTDGNGNNVGGGLCCPCESP
jgi:hypothetical protein